MKRTLVLVIALALSGAAVGAEGDPLTPTQWLLSAATRIFALENHIRGDIAVASDEESHIGKTHEVNPADIPGMKDAIDPEGCSFVLKRRDGPAIEEINFDKLGADVRTAQRGRYLLVQIPGLEGAQCEIEGKQKKCRGGLEMLLTDSEMELARRALRYIAKFCPAAQLPF